MHASRQSPSLWNLARNVSYTSLGTGIYSAAQWGIFLVVAKVAGASSAGQFALALAITAPLILLVNLQLAGLLATDAVRTHPFGRYLAVRLLGLAVGIAFIIAGAFLWHSNIVFVGVIVVVGLTKVVDGLSDLLYGLLQRGEHMGLVAIGWATNGLVSLSVAATAAFVTRSLLWIVVASAAGSIAALVVNFILSRRRLDAGESMRPEFNWPALTGLIRLAAPLGLVMLLLSMIFSVPRYFIAATLGSVQLGAFAAMAYLWLLGLTLISAVGQALSPRLAAEFSKGGHRSFVRILGVMLTFGFASGLIMVAAVLLGGHWLLSLIYRGDYRDQGWTFLLIAASGALVLIGSVLGFAMTAIRQLTIQVPIFAVVLAVSVISSAALIPRLGLTGAGLAALISFGVQVLLSAAVVWRATASIRLRTIDGS